MSTASTTSSGTGPGSVRSAGEQLADVAQQLAPGRTWTITTTVGKSVIGYLPDWAEGDPSATGVPLKRLSPELDDIRHHAAFDGQFVRVHSPTAGRDKDDTTEERIFCGSIECHPYAEDPDPRVPVVNIAIIGDLWINDLDPTGLADVAAKLRAQADRLDNEVRPALVAARDDWAAHHRS